MKNKFFNDQNVKILNVNQLNKINGGDSRVTYADRLGTGNDPALRRSSMNAIRNIRA